MLDKERKEFFAEKTALAFKERPYLERLRTHLLGIGGEDVVLWSSHLGRTFVEQLIQAGTAQEGANAAKRAGTPSNCHGNVVRVWLKNPVRYQMYTGYALSKDGIWRPHSWVANPKTKKIFETTMPRVTYLGVQCDPRVMVKELQSGEIIFNT